MRRMLYGLALMLAAGVAAGQEGRAELRAIRGDTPSNGLTLELMIPRNDAVGAWWIYR